MGLKRGGKGKVKAGESEKALVENDERVYI